MQPKAEELIASMKGPLAQAATLTAGNAEAVLEFAKKLQVVTAAS